MRNEVFSRSKIIGIGDQELELCMICKDVNFKMFKL